MTNTSEFDAASLAGMNAVAITAGVIIPAGRPEELRR